MTHTDDSSTHADLLARLGDDGTKELFRQLLEEAIQELIDAELTAQIGADRYQRSDARSNYRNGGRPPTLSTPAGDCDPKSPWQRGSNENTNGPLRQYFPKTTDMVSLTQADLDQAAYSLNSRPRQTLGWMTPSQKLAEALR